MTTTKTYQPGDEIDIDGLTIIITTWKGRSGVRYGWYAPAAEDGSDGYYPTAADAVDHAFRTLNGPRCHCGAPATMNASTGRVCFDHYDGSVD